MTTLENDRQLRPLAPPSADDAELRKIARERLEARRGFFTHAAVYVAVNLMLWGLWLAISLANGMTFPWPIFPSLGWGVGLALNAWSVFVERPVTEADVAAEVARLRHRGTR